MQNIISRVTGGNPSTIDGAIRSTIPNADLYFFNPYGIMFGPNAKLDVQGGFHASTADYLRLQDGGWFEARTPSNSLLTVAPVAAFGFLTETPASIATQESTLTVPPLKPLSLIGGHLQFQGTQPIQFDDLNIYATSATSLLKTTGGVLQLVAIGTNGEVIVSDNDLTLTGRGGDIMLVRTLVDTSGSGSGHLKVRGSRLRMQDSLLQANTLGNLNGGIMEIRLTESLYADRTSIGVNNAFASKTLGQGNAGSIVIQVPEFTLSRAELGTNTLTSANAGSIDLEVTRLTLLEGGSITSSVNGIGTGKGGTQTITATESILISGQALGTYRLNGMILDECPSVIDSSTYSVAEDSLGGGDINISTSRLDLVSGIITSASISNGNAGNITIQADNVNITEGGFIATSAVGQGLTGSIQLNVTDTLFLSGQRVGTYVVPVVGMRFDQNQSSIQSLSLLGSGGQLNLTSKNTHLTKEAAISTSSLGPLGKDTSSHLSLRTENLLITDGAQINSSNGVIAGTTFLSGNGRGGNLLIQAKHLIINNQYLHLPTGIFSDTYSQEPGGQIEVRSESLEMRGDEVAISAHSHNVGDAGQIHLQVSQVHLSQHSRITTAAIQGGGGNIHLTNLSQLLYLDDSQITTSVASGRGNGGNITIEKLQFAVLNKGLIRAQADEGQGGNIQIASDQFISTPDSLISASSNKGISGNVVITSPDNNLAGNLLTLSKEFRNIPTFSEFCQYKILEERSHFKVIRYRHSRPNPSDWQTSQQ